MLKNKDASLWLFVALVLFVVAYGLAGRSEQCKFNDAYQKSTVMAPNNKIDVAVADTQQLQQKGLSGQKCLSNNAGMLFKFVIPSEYGFWMKDMQMNIDIVWIDSNKTVIGIDNNLSPSTYPKVFTPIKDAQYVLEIGANSSSSYGILMGTKLSW